MFSVTIHLTEHLKTKQKHIPIPDLEDKQNRCKNVAVSRRTPNRCDRALLNFQFVAETKSRQEQGAALPILLT